MTKTRLRVRRLRGFVNNDAEETVLLLGVVARFDVTLDRVFRARGKIPLAGLLDHFLSIFIRELLTHTFLHETLKLCTRLQLHSAARTLRSCWVTGIVCWNFSCGTSTVFSAHWWSSPEVGGHLLRYHVCRKTCVLECLEYASWHVHFALWALVWATHCLPVIRAQCTVGVLAGTHWGALRCPGRMESGAERANPLWLCCVGGSGPVMWTSCIHAFSKQNQEANRRANARIQQFWRGAATAVLHVDTATDLALESSAYSCVSSYTHLISSP